MLMNTTGLTISNTVFPPTFPQSRPRSGSGLDDYFARGTVRGIEAKEHVFTEGDPKSNIYKILSGAVCLYNVLPDGRRQVIDFAYAGDTIGLGMADVETLNAQATVPTRVKCLPVGSLQSLADANPQFAFTLYQALSNELTSLRDHIVCVGQRSAVERLAGFLLTLSRRNARRGTDPLEIELPMTRTDIGDFLGLTIETVSRTFTRLKAMGLIEIDQGTTIRVLDIVRLESLSEGESCA